MRVYGNLRGRAALFVALGLAAALVAGPLAAHAAPPKPLPGTVQAAAAPAPGAATTATAAVGLRLREGPYLNSAVILVLKRGETVYPAAGPVWGDGISWAYVVVQRDGTRYEGFCATQYLAQYQDDVPPKDDNTPVATGKVKVTAYGGLRLRVGAGLSYSVDRIAPRFSTLSTTGATRQADGITWLEVIVGGKSLWGSQGFLEPVTP
jgi:hypothetical protein